MHTYATGAAFLDRNGNLVAADTRFTSHLGLGTDDPAPALASRADRDGALRALLAGEGPAVASVPGAEGAPVEVERHPARGGTFLLTRLAGQAEWLDHAVARIAAGLSHDVKNPLNAMALQIALLGEKLSARDAGRDAAAHLAAIREQIGRVNEVMRRFLDATDPSAPLGFTDVGALLSDVAGLFAHEARRRRIAVALDAAGGTARSRCDPARVGRVLVGLYARAMAETPESGKLSARAGPRDGAVEVVLEHATGDPGAGLGYDTEAAAGAVAALGGTLDATRGAGSERILLRLPGHE